MAEKAFYGECFIQVGLTALRDPRGNFLPGVPLYIKIDPTEVDQQTGLAECEKELLTDISGLFAGRFQRYLHGVQSMEHRP